VTSKTFPWNGFATIDRHEALSPFRLKIDANTADYPSLRETVRIRRERMMNQVRYIINQALLPAENRRRFANIRYS
jgi:hypothetical protein